MINEITCNSNNTIELSRGQLINWLNQILKNNPSFMKVQKIQQLGTGVVYCQLLDLIYPGKVTLSKINAKAKHQYQYLNNFKVLQQCFTKLNILKHIDIQRLVKCRYQDNLQFLQWFKKICDNSGVGAGQNRKQEVASDSVSRGRSLNMSRANSISGAHQAHYESIQLISCQNTHLKSTGSVQRPQKNLSNHNENAIINSNRNTEQKTNLKPRMPPLGNSSYNMAANKSVILDLQHQQISENLVQIRQEDEINFYQRKFCEIQHLFEKWDCNKTSQQLIEQVRKIILVAPQVDWDVNQGYFNENVQQEEITTNQ